VRALIVRGGWEGHEPVACTDLFIEFLTGQGFTVDVADTLHVYTDRRRLATAELIVQCWTRGRLTAEQEDGLVERVRSGAGFAGWHGGIIASGYENARYQHMVGGRFVFHPDGFLDYAVDVVGNHPIIAGVPRYEVHTEQYYCHVDPTLDVHATCTFADSGAVMPVVWTREHGAGRVFVSTLGHSPADLLVPHTRTITGRGLLWAAGMLSPDLPSRTGSPD
jgi:uncharacterized protein